MAQVLDRAVEAGEIVGALRAYGVTQRDIAAVTGVTDRAVRGWATSAIRPQRYDRLAGLRDIALLLSESLTKRGVGQWLHARNRILAGRRPIEVLAAGDADAVRAAAESFVDGAYV